jgi:hypothetical protein
VRPATIVLSVLILACGAATGCKPSNNKGLIEGTKWTSLPQVVQGQQMPEGFLKIEFTADKTFTYQLGTSTLTGKYSIGSGDEVTLFYDQVVGGHKKHVQRVRVKGNEIEIIDAQGSTRKFRRES